MNEPRRARDARITAGGRTDPGATDPAGRASVFDTLATSLGALPRVLLRDTDADGQAPSEPPSRPSSAEMPAPGAGPGRLQLLGEIARGGMGAVLKGRDPDLSRDLAVKVLLDRHRDDPDLLRRFIEEAQIAGQLQHPGIVPVYRLGTLPDHRPYFTMKLVKGRTLAALLAERPAVGGGSVPRPDRADRGGPDRGTDTEDRPAEHLPWFVAVFCRRGLRPPTRSGGSGGSGGPGGPGGPDRGESGRGGPGRGGSDRGESGRGGPGRGESDRGTEPPPTEDRPVEDLPRFVAVFEQVCRTMAYAHSRGVIHRDLKPSNIMVGGFGEVQVMDWGLAKVLARGNEAPRPDEPARPDLTVVATARSGSGPAGSDLSRAGSVIGTPAYMAPEQARGEVHRVDTRADVFALGAILCEVLTGQPPYAGRGAAEVQRKAARGDTAEALAAIAGSGADAELIAIARDCLAAARICYDTKRFTAAARFWAEAMAADPKLGDDRQAQHRYNAACAAALAAAGRGTDDPPPDGAARARLRRQALDWLNAERAAWARVLESGDAQARARVLPTLKHWRDDSDLAGVRDPDALAKLPEPERKAWQSLWADVDHLLKKMEGGQP